MGRIGNQDILSASEKVAAPIADISAASSEQASGIDEMSQAVAPLAEMTQQHAAMVEETTAASQTLAEQSVQLQHLLSAFRMDGQATAGSY